MQRPLISPGWALVLVFVLWGLAGKLDEPLDDDMQSPAAAPAVPSGVERESVFPPIRLLCYADPPTQDGAGLGSPRSTLVTYQHLRQTDARHNAHRLHCVVIDD